jgi:tRNA U34 5-carboxymethylaminomethyl modifying GTPase MnmE/TrmE
MHLPNQSDTICALATAPGLGAIAVIRVSGPDTFKIIENGYAPRTSQIKNECIRSQS